MTDTTGNPAMPAALAAILQEEGFGASVSGLLHVKHIGPVRLEVYHTTGDEWSVLSETRKSYSVRAVDLLTAGGLLCRIEAALSPDGPDQGGA